MDVHQDASAVADVAQDHGAEGMDLGASGPRPWDLDPLSRQRPSTAQPRLFVYEAGPWGSWRSRYRTKQGSDGGVVAPAWLPKTAGARVTPDRREAVQRARVARAGDRPAVEVPTGDAAARRQLTRARAEASRARTDATCRLNALLRRQERRSGGRATGGPAPRPWLSEVGCPTPAPPSVWHA